MTDKEIKILWKKSLINEFHWFFVKNYLTSDWWCTNTEPRYLNHPEFDVKEIEGEKAFRPKVLETVISSSD